MQILHVDTGREMRGGQRQVLLLVRGLSARGHTSVLLARKESPLWNAAKAEGLAVYPLSLKQLWLRSVSAEVVHAHDARAHTLSLLVPGAKLVVSRRVAFPIRRSVLSRWKYRRPRRYLAVSNFVGRQLLAAGVNEARIDVVYDGVQRSAGAADWSVDLPIVAPDSSDPQKGRDLVEQAAALLNDEIFFSQDLLTDLQRCSVFVYITRSEGLGSAALLAMSMGVPVVASHIDGLAEVLVHDESGLYVDNDPTQIAEAVRRIRENPAIASRLREGGKARVEKLFSVQTLLDRTLESYERALAG